MRNVYIEISMSYRGWITRQIRVYRRGILRTYTVNDRQKKRMERVLGKPDKIERLYNPHTRWMPEQSACACYFDR